MNSLPTTAELVRTRGCDQCQMLRIQGVLCHETGCPNKDATWDAERGQWIHYYECRECGDMIERGESCPCLERYTEADADETDDGLEEPKICTDVRCGLPADHEGPCVEDDEDDDEESEAIPCPHGNGDSCTLC